jgi:hypothetical protein
VIAELRSILAGDCGPDAGRGVAEAVRRAVAFAPEDPAWPVILPRLVERFATEMQPVIAVLLKALGFAVDVVGAAVKEYGCERIIAELAPENHPEFAAVVIANFVSDIERFEVQRLKKILKKEAPPKLGEVLGEALRRLAAGEPVAAFAGPMRNAETQDFEADIKEAVEQMVELLNGPSDAVVLRTLGFLELMLSTFQEMAADRLIRVLIELGEESGVCCGCSGSRISTEPYGRCWRGTRRSWKCTSERCLTGTYGCWKKCWCRCWIRRRLR